MNDRSDFREGLEQARAAWRGLSRGVQNFVIGCGLWLAGLVAINLVMGFPGFFLAWLTPFFGGWFTYQYRKNLERRRSGDWGWINRVSDQIAEFVDPGSRSGGQSPVEEWIERERPKARVPPTTPMRAAQSGVGQETADRALRMAGYDPADLPIKLSDLGLMIYADSTDPVAVAREEAVKGGRIGVTHVRPFIRLGNPLPRATQQNMTFEIVDQQGVTHFQDSASYTITPGSNFITTQTWLPLDDLTPEGEWMLRVRMGDTPLAVHRFGWRELPAYDPLPPEQNRARAAPPYAAKKPEVKLASDGEIQDLGSRSRRLADEPLSLEDLLSDQSTRSPRRQSGGTSE